VRILKDFKSNVLEVFIAKGLQADFAEVRILKRLEEIAAERGISRREKS
jgi:hypothetical protein